MNELPTPDKPLRIGTRASPLAMAQAHMAVAALIASHGLDPQALEIVPVTATGDRIQDRALAVLDVVHLLGQVTFTLAGQFGEVRCQAVAVGIVTRATYSGFCLTGSGIANDSAGSVGGPGDANGQQQTHE